MGINAFADFMRIENDFDPFDWFENDLKKMIVPNLETNTVKPVHNESKGTEVQWSRVTTYPVYNVSTVITYFFSGPDFT